VASVSCSFAVCTLLFVCAPAVAQERHSLRTPPDTATPFLDVIREASVRLRLHELRSSRPNSTREVRLWDGFGLGGLQLVILREAKHGWRAFRAYPVDRETRVRLAPLPDTADWARRWNAAVAILSSKAPFPRSA